jgi:hypothetical protein
MTKDKFLGTWKLKHFEIKHQNGSIDYPYGKHPIGYLIYHPDGHMAVTFMDSRKDFEKKIDQKKKIAAFGSCISYAGPYEIIDDHIIHHVDVCSIPDWIGTDLKRKYQLTNNSLTLSAEIKNITAILIWEHV